MPLFLVHFWIAPGFLGTFLGYSQISGYLSGLFPDFWVPFRAIPGFLGVILWPFSDFWYNFLLVKFEFFNNDPDFWVLILIFY